MLSCCRVFIHDNTIKRISNNSPMKLSLSSCYRVNVVSCSYCVIVLCIFSASTFIQSHHPYIEKIRFQNEAGLPLNERFAIKSWGHDCMQNNRANIKTPQWWTMTNHNLMRSDGTLAVSSQSPMLHVFYLVQHTASLSDSLDQRQSIRICV